MSNGFISNFFPNDKFGILLNFEDFLTIKIQIISNRYFESIAETNFECFMAGKIYNSIVTGCLVQISNQYDSETCE